MALTTYDSDKRDKDDSYADDHVTPEYISQGIGDTEKYLRQHDLQNRENSVYDDGSESSSGESGSSKRAEPSEINNAEKAAAIGAGAGNATSLSDTLGKGFNPVAGASGIKNMFWGSSRRKKATAGGGILGLLLGGGFFGLTIISGPLELIHEAQLMQKFHFSSIQQAQDNRMSKIARYIRDPSKPQNTRLGVLGNAVADRLEAKMNATGVESAYTDGLKYYDGYTIDTTNDNFKDLQNKPPDEVKQLLSERLGIPADSINVNDSGKLAGKISIDGSKIGGYRDMVSLNRTMLKEAGYSKVTSAVGARIMGKRAGISWHPIAKLDSKIMNAGYDAIKRAMNKNEAQEIDNGGGPEFDLETDPQTDSKGNPIDANAPATAENTKEAAKTTLQDGSTTGTAVDGGNANATKSFTDDLGGKLKGGVAAIIAIFCILQGLGDHINQIRLAQVVLPMMRIGMQAITVGNQVMSGKDITAQQVGYFKDQLDTTDSNGNVTSTWNQAKSIQYELGEPQTGTDVPSSAKVFNKGNPFSWTNDIPGLGKVCSAVNSVFGQIIGLAFSGGPIGAGFQYFVGKYLVGPGLNSAAQWIAGKPIDPFATGADRGNLVNYGARLAANDQAVAAGGAVLSAASELALKTDDGSVDKSAFQSQSVAYRLFNPYDDNSLISKVIDQQDTGMPQNINHLATSFASIFSSVFKIPATLFSSVAHADSISSTYDYGFPAYGFSEADQTNPIVGNPFDNATQVANILSGPQGQQYIAKASQCFNVTIAQTNNVWGVSGGGSVSNLYDDKYSPSDCADSSDPNWLRIRFFVLDTETMESYACYSGADNQSCTDVGLND